MEIACIKLVKILIYSKIKYDVGDKAPILMPAGLFYATHSHNPTLAS